MAYINNLAKELDRHTENFNGIESCRSLDELFEKRKLINRVFLRENVIEKFEMHIKELTAFIQNGENADAEATLEKIKLYTKDLHEARAY